MALIGQGVLEKMFENVDRRRQTDDTRPLVYYKLTNEPSAQELKMLAPSPYFFIVSIFLVLINMFARFNEIPSVTFKIFGKKTKHYKMDSRGMQSVKQHENSIPAHKHSLFVWVEALRPSQQFFSRVRTDKQTQFAGGMNIQLHANVLCAFITLAKLHIFLLKAVISFNQLESGNDKGQESSYKFLQVYCNLVKRNNNKTNVNVEKRKKKQ